jgi:glycosyltransferase involved in cell wall biosynthesis
VPYFKSSKTLEECRARLFWDSSDLPRLDTLMRERLPPLVPTDYVLTVSDNNGDFYARRVDARKISVIPTGVDLKYFRPSSDAEEPNFLVFTGSMDWLPNEDAVMYFVNQILPRVHSHIPKARLLVVGRRPSERLRALANRNDALEITGQVADIRPYVQRASVCIVPLRVGGGTRLKIFEAMAMGKAIVSSSVGAEGLPVNDGDNIILANDPEEFAGRVVELLRGQEARRRLGQAARQLVEQNYSWSSVSEHFDAVLARVARQRRDAQTDLTAAQERVTHVA